MRIEPLERLEDPLAQLGGDAGAMVDDGKHRMS